MEIILSQHPRSHLSDKIYLNIYNSEIVLSCKDLIATSLQYFQEQKASCSMCTKKIEREIPRAPSQLEEVVLITFVEDNDRTTVEIFVLSYR